MNIMITGCNGFLGKQLQRIKNHNIFPTTREIVDLCDFKQVEDFIDKNKIEVILHAAIKGGRRNRTDQPDDFYQNILSFENLAKNLDKIKLMINFDSAASYGRQKSIDGPTESQFPRLVPADYYGLSKFNISLRCRQLDNVYNLRIFNCFGPSETDDRMIKGNILRYISGQEIVIHYNKTMDFFFIDDLLKIVEFYLNNFDSVELHKELNLCYEEKTSLFDIATKINNLSDKKVKILIEDRKEENFNYFGNSSFLKQLKIPLKGLDSGIIEMYNFLLKDLKNDN